MRISQYNISGPPFSHPSEPFRAHFVGSTSAKSSPDFYLECISALVETYRLDIQRPQAQGLHPDSEEEAEGPRNRIASAVPLIINTPGWVKGMGRELLRQIEDEVQPTHVVEFENSDMDQVWSEPASSRPSNLVPLIIERAPSISLPTRYSAADHRAISMLSYFHSREKKVPISDITGRYEEEESQSRREWLTDLPLCAQPPWEVSWTEGLDHVVFIGSGAEDVIPSEVLRVLNGAIVGLVALDPHTIPWIEQPQPLDKAHAGAIPYVQGSSPPPPSSSNCVGLALVRSVRPSSNAFHILTPVPPSHLATVRVLVMGEIQLPIWGMLDYRAAEETAGTLAGVGYDKVPFLRWTTGGAAAIHGSRKKRVRRNLMRKSQM
jgi:polynucleotide 5'-hydroxyl-kinase GRC3/NOL9